MGVFCRQPKARTVEHLPHPEVVSKHVVCHEPLPDRRPELVPGPQSRLRTSSPVSSTAPAAAAGCTSRESCRTLPASVRTHPTTQSTLQGTSSTPVHASASSAAADCSSTPVCPAVCGCKRQRHTADSPKSTLTVRDLMSVTLSYGNSCSRLSVGNSSAGTAWACADRSS